MLQRTAPYDLPLELSSGPFSATFVGQKDPGITFHPGWVILDRDGIAVATVARASDANFLVGLLNRKG